MQFYTLIISALAATALAAPTEHKPTTTKVVYPPAPTTTTKAVHTPAPTTTTKATHAPAPTTTKSPYPGGGSYNPCKSVVFQSLPRCCAVNAAGIASLDCAPPSKVPTSPDDFRATCKATGDAAQCCTLDLLGQALLCSTPVGL